MRYGFLLLLTLLIAGCGTKESGPERHHVSGQVTFDGKPVPAGTIYFETPTGSGGSAEISNGKYDTRKGKGTSGGKFQALIQGYDGQGANRGEMGKPIFKPYRVEVELPPEDTTKDFEVPASQAEGLVISDDPA